MAKILQRVLSVLPQIYRFDSSQGGPESFDTAAAIQAVHDVSEEAERAAAAASIPPGVQGGTLRDGLFSIAFNLTANDSDSLSLSPYNLNLLYKLDLDAFALWLVSFAALGESTAPTLSEMTVAPGTNVAGDIPLVGQSPNILLFKGNGSTLGSGAVRMQEADLAISSQAAVAGWVLPRPLLMARDADISCRQQAGAGVDGWYIFNFEIRVR